MKEFIALLTEKIQETGAMLFRAHVNAYIASRVKYVVNMTAEQLVELHKEANEYATSQMKLPTSVGNIPAFDISDNDLP